MLWLVFLFQSPTIIYNHGCLTGIHSTTMPSHPLYGSTSLPLIAPEIFWENRATPWRSFQSHYLCLAHRLSSSIVVATFSSQTIRKKQRYQLKGVKFLVSLCAVKVYSGAALTVVSKCNTCYMPPLGFFSPPPRAVWANRSLSPPIRAGPHTLAGQRSIVNKPSRGVRTLKMPHLCPTSKGNAGGSGATKPHCRWPCPPKQNDERRLATRNRIHKCPHNGQERAPFYNTLLHTTMLWRYGHIGGWDNWDWWLGGGWVREGGVGGWEDIRGGVVPTPLAILQGVFTSVVNHTRAPSVM